MFMPIPGPAPASGSGPVPDSGSNPNSNPKNLTMKIKRVTHRPTNKSKANRDPSAAEISNTGRVKTNANGADEYDELARSEDVNVETFTAGYGYDADARVITLYAEPADALGTAGIRRSTHPRAYTFSIASLFEDAPQLRFAVRRQCPLVPGVDNEGRACLIIPLDSTLEKIKSPRTKKNSKANKNNPGTSTATENAK